jgi:hypothetical protein
MSVQCVPSAAFRPFLFLVLLGAGVWTLRADTPTEKVLFEENFAEAPGKGWSWHKEIKDHWVIDKELFGGD